MEPNIDDDDDDNDDDVDDDDEDDEISIAISIFADTSSIGTVVSGARGTQHERREKRDSPCFSTKCVRQEQRVR
jgi:hypothetical protein